jgi:hypothetical protein
MSKIDRRFFFIKCSIFNGLSGSAGGAAQIEKTGICKKI